MAVSDNGAEFQKALDELEESLGPLWPVSGKPGLTADRLLTEDYLGDTSTWRFYGGDFYHREPTLWKKRPADLIEAEVNEILGGVLCEPVVDAKGKKKRPQPWNPNTAKVKDVMNQIQFKATREWVMTGMSDPDMGGGERVFFQNGVLDIKSGMLGDHSPEFFNTHCVPVDYDPEAYSPLAEKLIHRAFEDDAERIEVHMRAMAMMLSGATSLQKFYLLTGPPGTGKSSLLNVMDTMFGRGSVAHVSLSDFGTTFGLESCIGAKVIRISDDRSSRISGLALSNFLKVTGGDPVNIHKKSVKDWTGVLGAVVTLVSNELPGFIDSSGAVRDRMLINATSGSSIRGTEEEDRHIVQKIIDWELAGFVNMILPWVSKLGDRLAVPEFLGSAISEMDRVSNPVMQWLEERFLSGEYGQGPTRWVWTDDAFKDYSDWLKENKFEEQNSRAFGWGLKAAMGRNRAGLVRKQVRVDGGHRRKYVGFGPEVDEAGDVV